MGNENLHDETETLRRIIEADKREAYGKYHGDNFPERFSHLQTGKLGRRPWPRPLWRGLTAASLVILAGLWLIFKEGADRGPSAVGRVAEMAPLERVLRQAHALEKKAGLFWTEAGKKTIGDSLPAVHDNSCKIILYPDGITPTIGQALEACLGAKKWRERPWAPPPPMTLEKEKIRSTLFAEIISKFKEV